MSEFKIVYNLDRQKWSDFIYNHPEGNIFQTPEMFEVYRDTNNWEPLFLAVIDSSDNVLGILLTVIQKEFRGFLEKLTARAIVWGGPLIINTEKRIEILKFLLDALDIALKKEAIYIQFRNLYDFSDNKVCFMNNGYHYEEHLNFLINLERGEEYLWSNLDSSKRRAIKKAVNEKLEVRILSDISGIRESYNILKSFYREIKIPLPDKSFFESIFRFLYPKNMVKVFAAYYLTEIVGVLYIYAYKERLFVEYTTSLVEYHNKRPNEILYWEALKWGCRNGYKIFDFGGAGRPDKEYGVRKFKEKFRGELVNYGRFVKVYRQYIFGIIKIYLQLRQRL